MMHLIASCFFVIIVSSLGIIMVLTTIEDLMPFVIIELILIV